MINATVGAGTGAGAASRYGSGSGSDQKMRLLAAPAPAPQHWILRYQLFDGLKTCLKTYNIIYSCYTTLARNKKFKYLFV
jgi:hypothetical protein